MKIPEANPKILTYEHKETYFYTSHRLYFIRCQFAYRQWKALWLNTDIGIKCQLIAILSYQCFCASNLMKKDCLKIRALKRKKKSEKGGKKKKDKEITMLHRTKISNYALILVWILNVTVIFIFYHTTSFSDYLISMIYVKCTEKQSML